MGLFLTAMRGTAGFLSVEIFLLILAWGGVDGEEYWIWIALTGQILINVLVFLNLAGLASIWLLGFLGGVLSPLTVTASANALTLAYARWTIGFGHAVSITIMSLVFLEPSLWVYIGMVLTLTVAAQHTLTFPTTTSVFKWVSLGVIAVTLAVLLFSALPPLYKMVVLGEPYVSAQAEKSQARGEGIAVENEETYRKEANDRVVAVIRKDKIRISQLPPKPGTAKDWETWGGPYVKKGSLQVQDAQIYWETSQENQKRTLPNAVKGTPKALEAPWLIIGLLVALAISILVALFSKRKWVWGISILLLILLILTGLNGKTRKDFWQGSASRWVTGEAILDPYVTSFTPKRLTAPDGAYTVKIDPMGRPSYEFDCAGKHFGASVMGFRNPDKSLKGGSGELRVDGSGDGEPILVSGGGVEVKITPPSTGCVITGPVSPKITLIPR